MFCKSFPLISIIIRRTEGVKTMAYYEDFTKYTYDRGQNKETNTLNIGWLEGTKQINRGKVSQEFLDNLWEYMKCPINRKRGLYCNVCLDGERNYFKAVYNGCEIKLGDAEIRVIDKKANCVYAAPTLILHYIISHNYLPPSEFINAVIDGPKPGSKEYSKLVSDMHADMNEEDSWSGIRCPQCGSKLNTWLPKIKKQITYDKKIKIIGVFEKCESDLTGYDYRYPYLCLKCGNIFEIEYDVIKTWM